jgi:hypothetical protein
VWSRRSYVVVTLLFLYLLSPRVSGGGSSLLSINYIDLPVRLLLSQNECVLSYCTIFDLRVEPPGVDCEKKNNI